MIKLSFIVGGDSGYVPLLLKWYGAIDAVTCLLNTCELKN